MFSLVRSATRLLYLDCQDPAPLERFLLHQSFVKRFEREEDQDLCDDRVSLLSLHGPGGEEKILISRGAPETILVDLINQGLIGQVTSARLAPGIILMRIVGRVGRVLAKLSEEYGGKRIQPNFLLEATETPHTALFFTSKSLNRSVMREELFPVGLLIPGDLSTHLPHIREKSIDLLNLALEGKKWTEAEIRIYDAAGKFALHYRRFILAVRALELGVIIQESWGKDYPMAMLSVPVYKIRLVTPFSLTEIKKVAIALEFSRKGPRLADMDVMEGKEKMHWGSFLKSEGLKERYDIIGKFQKELYRRLGPKDTADLEALEREALEGK